MTKMNFSGKRIIVTGAGGFIGSHLSEKLVTLGCEVTCFVRYNSRGDSGLLEIIPKEIKKELNYSLSANGVATVLYKYFILALTS